METKWERSLIKALTLAALQHMGETAEGVASLCVGVTQ